MSVLEHDDCVFVSLQKEVVVNQFSSFPSMDWGDSSGQSLKDGSTRGSMFGSVALLRLKKTKRV